jgi:3',5'-cyclic AMP phosphodiesterase CpdA
MWSGGQKQSTQDSLEADPGEFQTLTRPKGRLLARIAVLNDLHVGERCSGTISGDPENSVPDCYTVPDYAYKMVDAALTEVAGTRSDLLVANGDLTDRGRDQEVKRALERLRKTKLELLITRGNHDRRLPGDCDVDGDCLRSQAFPGQEAGDSVLRTVKRIGGQVAVVGLDSCNPDTGRGRLDLGDQPAWLDGTLAKLKAEGRIVIVAFHHPILGKTEPIRFSDGVVEGQAEILGVLARHDHVKLVINGHTHRNNLGFDPTIGARLPFLENGAVKEYPAGYALLDVYETGIVRTFHRPDSDFSREWVNISAKQIEGIHPSLTRGSLGSRAFVTSFSKKGLATAESATKGDTGLAAGAPKRIGIAKLLNRGLEIEIEGYPGTVATGRLIARFRRDGVGETVQLASARRKGSGKLVLKVGRKSRSRLSRLKKGRKAILQVTSAGRIYEQEITLSRKR